MKNQTSLSFHLNKKLNESNQINEGLGLFTGLFQAIGSITAMISPKENAMTALMKEQKNKSKENIKKRLDALKSSKENAQLAKMKAAFAARERQLDLRNQDKVNRFKAMEQKFKRTESTMSKTNGRYSDSELSSMESRWDRELNNLNGQTIPEGMDKVRENMALILRKPDGTLRTDEERQTFIENEGKSLWDECQEITGKHESDIKKAMQDPSYSEFVDEWGESSQRMDELKEKKNQLAEKEQRLQEGQKKIQKIKDLRKQVEPVKKKLEEANANFEQGGTFYDKDKFEGGDQETKEAIAIATKSIYDSLDDSTKEDADKRAKAIKDALIKQGFPKEIAEKISTSDFPVSKDSSEDEWKTKFAGEGESILKDVDSDQLQKIRDGYGKARIKAENMRDSYREQYNSMPDPDIESHPANSGNADIDAYKEMDETDRTLCDPDTEEGKAELEQLNQAKAEADKKIREIEDSEEARQRAAAEVHKQVEFRSTMGDFKDDIENEISELAPGEYKDENGKIGYKDYTVNPPEFRPKKENMSDKEREEYSKQLSASLALAPVPSAEGTEGYVEIKKKVVKDADGQDQVEWYKVVDGEEKKISEDDAKKIAIDNAIKSNQRADVIAAKTNVKDAIVALSKKETPEEIEEYLKDKTPAEKEAIKKALQNPDQFFKGVDEVDGLDSEIQKALSSDTASVFKEYAHDELGVEDKDWSEFNSDEKEEEAKNAKFDDESDMEDESDNEEDRKKQDPHKVWRRKTYKRGDKSFKTKSYYNKKGNSISAKEFKEKVRAYNQSQSSSSLSAYIANLNENKQSIRHINNFISL